jgi:hypothetical protein
MLSLTKKHNHPPRRHEAVRHAITRALARAGAMFALLAAVGALGPVGALANQYNGMLSSGTLSIASPGLTITGQYTYAGSPGSVAANNVWQQYSWSAPGSTQFGGFIYTSAWFQALDTEATGGESIGFTGSGGNTPTDLNFPWTQDCSITESDSPRTWAATGGPVGSSYVAPGGIQGYCETTGNANAWTFDNSEIESLAPSVNPVSNYKTLTFSGWCARDSACDDAAGAQVTNLSGWIVDPNDEPTGSASWAESVNGSDWYQTNSGGIGVNFSASDPAGVCSMHATLSGANNYGSSIYGSSSGTTNPGPGVGAEFASATSACAGAGGSAVNGSWTLPGGLTTGKYDLNLIAANPGNYQAQGFSDSGSPTVATYGNAISVDDTAPATSWVNPPGTWTSNTDETLDVMVGPSGLSTVTCTDNGGNVAPTMISGSTSGAGTTVWSVPTVVNGDNAVACIATNGDANGGLTASQSATFDVDTVVPEVTFADSDYTSDTWTNASQTVGMSATGGPSGIQRISCFVDGLSAPFSGPSLNQITITGNGQHVLDCTATSNTNVVGENTYDVDIDSNQPTETFVVNGAAPSSDWLSGTPVVQVIGSEQGGLLSGLGQITCSINGGAAFKLPAVNAANDYTSSFELQQNGTDVVSCTGTTVAGTTQTTAMKVTVNVDNPNFSATPSALIDNGKDPFSAGPSQSQWYTTTQSVTITANDTGGSAPISAISCKGAVTGSWPLSDLNTDPQGGEQITVNVPAPGGDLSCTAVDSAGNVYALGSYLFQIDNTPPAGYFEPQSQWPTPDEIEIHATDNAGSGVAVVRVYGQSSSVDQGQPQLVGDATYDASTGNYEVAVPDGIAPWVAGNWKFYANVIDAAGNQGQISASQDGSTEDLTLPLRENTSVTASVKNVLATPEATIPTALAAAALPKPLAGATAASASPRTAHVATATAARAETKTKSKPKSKPKAKVLTVAYGKAVKITGTLKNVKRKGKPISGARILVYQVITGTRAYKKLGSARTNAKGNYSYKVRPGASRTLYVVYPGTKLLRSAVSDLQERFNGKVSLNASKINAGGKLVITGTVKGGHIPSGGLNVTIDYRQAGAPGSGTLGTVRTDRKGRYRFVQHFATNTKGLVYELWAVIPGNQPKWPYLKATTHKLVRHIL